MALVLPDRGRATWRVQTASRFCGSVPFSILMAKSVSQEFVR
jgi:hypothetical protein